MFCRCSNEETTGLPFLDTCSARGMLQVALITVLVVYVSSRCTSLCGDATPARKQGVRVRSLWRRQRRHVLLGGMATFMRLLLHCWHPNLDLVCALRTRFGMRTPNPLLVRKRAGEVAGCYEGRPMRREVRPATVRRWRADKNVPSEYKSGSCRCRSKEMCSGELVGSLSVVGPP